MSRKVWHITKTLYGGAGAYALRLSDALRNAGMDSCVLCEDSVDTEGAQELSPDPARLSGFASRVIRSLSHRLSSRAYQSFLAPERSKSKQMPQAGDIIHLHGLTGWLGIRGLNALIPEGSPVFWTSHDLWPLSGGCIVYSGCDGYREDCGSCPILRKGLKGWAKAELRMKQKFVKEKKVQPVANSRWMAGHIEESRIYSGMSDVPVIPPIVDPVYFSTEIDTIREKLQISSDKKVIALGAREITDRHKGIPEFLEALAMRDELAEQCVILLFGEGELEFPENLNVKALGRLNSAEELAQVYASSDVFVSPSAMETFGMVLTEAQACGTPVVAFDVGGVPDAVSEESAEFLVPNGDFESLLNAVGKVFEKSSKGNGSWRVDRDWARERFEASVIAKRQLEVYSRSTEVLSSLLC
jgi:glycosyltransferase involved in cell wall biosynthesis